MSGFGERFRAGGYTLPKPLIQVDGKTMVEHVVNLFPGGHDFVFICNEEHLADTSLGMRETLNSLAKSANIVSIPSHKLGPVHAVVSAAQELDLNAETIVNYCDFTCTWSFEDFVDDIRERDLDGSVPAYRGFHPHSGGTTNYAYIIERNMLLRTIREKLPFTPNKVAEFASSGTYYFRSAELMLALLTEQVSAQESVSDEFYVSSSMDLLAKRGGKVGVYEVEHFMQWGTPQDLEEYTYHSAVFEKLSNLSPVKKIQGTGTVFVLASGLGERFAREGYACPKPLLPVSGETLVAQVSKAGGGPRAVTASVVSPSLAVGLQESGFDKIYRIPTQTNSQAESANILLNSATNQPTGVVTILPSDTLFCEGSDSLSRLASSHSDFLIAWASSPTPFARKNPDQYGWLSEDSGRVFADVKRAPSVPNSLVLSGAFTFSSLKIYNLLFSQISRGPSLAETEVFLDDLVNVADSLGIPVFAFVPELTVSLGTPVEYESFIYWQRCFTRWSYHSYSEKSDPFRPEGNGYTTEIHQIVDGEPYG